MSDKTLAVITSLANNNLNRNELRELSTEFFNEFRETFDKLGSFKKAREEFENAGFFYRLFHKGEIKKAERNSIELQEKMAQHLGKLTVFQICTQEGIKEQQSQLSRQQNLLEVQTSKIACANGEIAKQQSELSKQQMELKDLVDNYFKLKGLTANHAKKLVAYAQEIEAAKSEVMHALQQQQEDFSGQIEQTQNMQADAEHWATERIEHELEVCHQRNEATLQEQNQLIQNHAEQLVRQVHTAQENTNALLQEQNQRIETLCVTQADNKSQLEEQIERAAADTKARLDCNEAQMQEQFQQQDGQIKSALQAQNRLIQQQAEQQSEQMRAAQKNTDTLLQGQKQQIEQLHATQDDDRQRLEGQIEEHRQRIEQAFKDNERLNQSQKSLQQKVSRWTWLSAAGSTLALSALLLFCWWWYRQYGL